MSKQKHFVFNKAICFLPRQFNPDLSKKIFKKILRFKDFFEILKPAVLDGYFSVLTREFSSRKDSLYKVRYIFSTFILLSYLFISPHGAVQATLPEKVIPAKSETAVVVVKDQVLMEKTPEFKTPLKGYISTYFSSRHQGIDIPNPHGTEVFPFTDGEVVEAGYSNLGYGNLVVLRHKLGYESLYAHLSSINVKIGDKVTTETLIGRVGSTGFSTGSHLHFEVHANGRAVNPLVYVNPTK